MNARISDPVASPIPVTGGTGTLGRLVVARLRPRALRASANLAPEWAVGRRTWEDFLTARVGSPSDSRLAAA